MKEKIILELLKGVCEYKNIDKSDLKKIIGFKISSLYNTGVLVSINKIPVAWFHYQDRYLGAFIVKKELQGNGLGRKIIYDMFEPGETVGIFMDENPKFWKSVSSEYVENGFGYGISKIKINKYVK